MEGKLRVIVWAGEPGWIRTLSWMLMEAGFDVTHATSQSQAVALASGACFEVAVVDVDEPSATGVFVVQELRRTCPHLPVVLTTSARSERAAMGALKDQVFGRIRRPDDLDRLAVTAREAAAYRAPGPDRHLEHAASGGQGGVTGPRAGSWIQPDDLAAGALIGKSEGICRARRLVAQVAPSDMTVLIRGESGTGKDVVAHLIHALSRRARTGDFVKISCPAIPDALLESELFGHERGAFTGAVSLKPGRFELAEAGTIFLDEIGLMSLGMQGKLLDVIEHKQFVRVGGKKTLKVDTRIIAATNSPLEGMIEGGTFRPDLFYRLRQFSITLPPLRDRVQDVPLLCEHFLGIYAARDGFRYTELPAEILPMFMRHDWPGNVRELEALVGRYALCGDVDTLRQALTPSASVAGNGSGSDKLEAAERTAILTALTECRWNRRQAAVSLGISYSALRRRMAKHNIDGVHAASGKPGASARCTPGRADEFYI